MRRSGVFGPVLVICLGVLFLLNNFGMHLPLRYLLRDSWPFILIAVGAWQITRHLATGFGDRTGTLTGGILLITVGTLFALQNLAGLSFRVTWPVLLIAVGVTGLVGFRSGHVGWGGSWHRGGFRR